MHNPTRRNKNIGTPKQGHGKNNQLVIPFHWEEGKDFVERLDSYLAIKRTVNGKEYTFLVERTRKQCVHACTIDDIAQMISYIDPNDLAGLSIIVFRQPKFKEVVLNPAWGRLKYFIEIGDHEGPAIFLEAIDMRRSFYWPKKLKIHEQQEVKRLINDGHEYETDKRKYTFYPTVDTVRNTQLYRTFIHEVGHYVEYLEKVARPAKNLGRDTYSDYWNAYWQRPVNEREVYAHTYADRVARELREKGLIPFNRILDSNMTSKEGLRMEDFILV